MPGMDIVIRPGDLNYLPGAFHVKVIVRGAHTGGVMAVIEETLQPKAFITPHTHANDVWVFVQSGTVGALVGEQVSRAGVGEWILKPRDVSHAMWNAGDQPARILEVLTPAGTEEWFEELAALAPGDSDGFADSCRRHGIEFHDDSPWTERLRAQFGL